MLIQIECVATMPAEECDMKRFEEYLRKAIEAAPTPEVANALRALLPQAGARSGGGGGGNPPPPAAD
jgi:hypothetical protein